jgi:hypothetical protein
MRRDWGWGCLIRGCDGKHEVEVSSLEVLTCCGSCEAGMDVFLPRLGVGRGRFMCMCVMCVLCDGLIPVLLLVLWRCGFGIDESSRFRRPIHHTPSSPNSSHPPRSCKSTQFIALPYPFIIATISLLQSIRSHYSDLRKAVFKKENSVPQSTQVDPRIAKNVDSRFVVRGGRN